MSDQEKDTSGPENKSSSAASRMIFVACIAVFSICTVVFFIVNPAFKADSAARANRFSDAVALYEEALTWPMLAVDPFIYLDAARCERRLGHFREAGEYLNRAQAVKQKHPIAEGIVGIFRGQPFDYALHREKGWIAFKSGDLQSALTDFESALKIQETSDVYLDLAAIYEDKKDFDKASATYDKAQSIAFGEQKERVMHEHAIFLRDTGRADEAVDELTKALSVCPCDRAYFDRAMIYKSKGDFKAALADLNIADRRNRTEKYLHERAYVKIELGDYSGAIQDVDIAEKVGPPCAQLSETREDAKRLLAGGARSTTDGSNSPDSN